MFIDPVRALGALILKIGAFVRSNRAEFARAIVEPLIGPHDRLSNQHLPDGRLQCQAPERHLCPSDHWEEAPIVIGARDRAFANRSSTR
jgi:hypothetical protein